MKPDKIDTQGMTAAGVENSSMLKTVHYPDGYPPMPAIKKRILPKNEELYKELKELINEVLDEREMRRYTNISIGSTLNDNLQ